MFFRAIKNTSPLARTLFNPQHKTITTSSISHNVPHLQSLPSPNKIINPSFRSAQQYSYSSSTLLLPLHHTSKPISPFLSTTSRRLITIRGREPSSKRFSFAEHNINLNEMRDGSHSTYKLTPEEEFELEVQEQFAKKNPLLRSKFSPHIRSLGTLTLIFSAFLINSLYFNWREETEYVTTPEKMYEYALDNGLEHLFTEAFPIDNLQHIFACKLSSQLHDNSKEYLEIQRLMNKHLSLGLHLITLSKSSRNTLESFRSILEHQQLHPLQNIYRQTYFNNLSIPAAPIDIDGLPDLSLQIQHIQNKSIPAILEELAEYTKILDTTIETITEEMSDLFATYTRPTQLITHTLPLEDIVQDIALSYATLNSLKLILKHVNLWILYAQTRQFYHPHPIPHFSQLVDIWDALYPVVQPKIGQLDIDYEAEVSKLQKEQQKQSEEDEELSQEEQLAKAFASVGSQKSLDEDIFANIQRIHEKLHQSNEQLAAAKEQDEQDEFNFLIQQTSNSINQSANKLLSQQQNPPLFGIPTFIHPPQIIKFFQKLIGANGFFRFQSMSVYPCEVNDNAILIPPQPNEIINLTLYPFIGADRYHIELDSPTSAPNKFQQNYTTSFDSAYSGPIFKFLNNYPIILLQNNTDELSSSADPKNDQKSSNIIRPWDPKEPVLPLEDTKHTARIKEVMAQGLPINQDLVKFKGFDITPYLQTQFYFISTPLPRIVLPTTASFDDESTFISTFSPTIKSSFFQPPESIAKVIKFFSTFLELDPEDEMKQHQEQLEFSSSPIVPIKPKEVKRKDLFPQIPISTAVSSNEINFNTIRQKELPDQQYDSVEHGTLCKH